MGAFVIWRLSFIEIALHGDSTTVEITSKNIIFLICFIFNCVSFLLQKISWEGIRHLLSFLCKKKLVSCTFVIFAIFPFEKSLWIGAFVIWRISFVEIALHGDSTTVEIISKNNVFLICFILNGVSFLRQKISWEGIRHLFSFLYRKKLVPCAFVIYAVFSFEKSFWMGAFVICHLSFVEIALHGDSTTLEIISKNNVFLTCFILYGVSFLSQKISWEGIRHLLSFLHIKKLVACAFVIYAFFSFEKSFWIGAFVIWRISFFEIALHGDSTTVEIISKNNVFLICFLLNGVSFLWQKISWEGIRHLLSFLYRKKLVPCAFVIFAVFSFEKSF